MMVGVRSRGPASSASVNSVTGETSAQSLGISHSLKSQVMAHPPLTADPELSYIRDTNMHYSVYYEYLEYISQIYYGLEEWLKR